MSLAWLDVSKEPALDDFEIQCIANYDALFLACEHENRDHKHERVAVRIALYCLTSSVMPALDNYKLVGFATRRGYGVMRGVSAGIGIAVVTVLSGCAIAPDLPPDFALPVREILQHTSCELQHAFKALNNDATYRRFKAGQWLVTVSLSPKVDTDATISGGFTKKNPFIGNPTNFVTWAVSGPGLQADLKGERTGGINFTFKSNELMKDKTLRCPASPSVHALAQHLGVGEWLTRTAAAMNVASSAGIDKPTYDTDITIKFSGNGTYTYTFPAGTNLASLGGSYSLDEQLNISMAPIAPKQTLVVVSLPAGQNLKSDGTPPNQALTSAVSIQSAQSRLDTIAVQQAIRNLQIRP